MACANGSIRRIVAGCCLLLVGGLKSPPANAVEVDSSAERIAELVRQLGDPVYVARQQATRELAEIGVPAKSALLDALKSSDAEVRFRARRLLVLVLELDFQDRLEAFVSESDGQSAGILGGWKQYRALVGDDPAVRRLFVEMQRSERGLLETAESEPAAAGGLLESRCEQLQELLELPRPHGLETLPVGSVAALLLVAGNEQVAVSSHAASYLNSFSYQQAFQEAADRGEWSQALKNLMGIWVERDMPNDTTASFQNLMLALRYGLHQGVTPALVIVRAPGTPPHMRQYGILALGRLGGMEHVAALEALLSDQAVCATQDIDDREVETQVRDVALAVMLHLSEQDLRSYGFDRVQPHPMLLFNTGTLGFTQSPAREAALAKWRDWARAQDNGSAKPKSSD